MSCATFWSTLSARHRLTSGALERRHAAVTALSQRPHDPCQPFLHFLSFFQFRKRSCFVLHFSRKSEFWGGTKNYCQIEPQGSISEPFLARGAQEQILAKNTFSRPLPHSYTKNKEILQFCIIVQARLAQGQRTVSLQLSFFETSKQLNSTLQGCLMIQKVFFCLRLAEYRK